VENNLFVLISILSAAFCFIRKLSKKLKVIPLSQTASENMHTLRKVLNLTNEWPKKIPEM
jgi:hypothetical protein